nr:Catechol 1,2-dioxygenase [Klebsiella pneumoniae]
MSNVFVQQPAIQKLLRDSAGLDVAGGDERFKAIIHRLLENICTLIDDYNVTEEEFWHAVNYLHELGGRQEAALLAAGLGLSISSICARRHRRGSASGNRHPAHHRRAAVRG